MKTQTENDCSKSKQKKMIVFRIPGLFRKIKKVIKAPSEYATKIINGGFYEIPGQGKSYYGEGADNYNKKRVSSKSWGKEQLVAKQLLSELPDGLSVLDVPFGTGRFVPFYLDKKMDVYGLEKSPDMILAAKNSLGSQFSFCDITIGDATELNYPNNFFDLVVSFRFLPHIISYRQVMSALNEFSRVTRKYAILQLGERKNNEYRRRLPKDHEKMESWLYPSEIEELLNNAGFKIVKKSEPVKSATSTTAKYAKNVGKWHVYLCEKSKTVANIRDKYGDFN